MAVSTPPPVVVEVAGQNSILGWLTAVAAVAAALVPLVFFLLERRDRQRAEAQREEAERQRELSQRAYAERELAERRREQANLIHVWTGGLDEDFYFFFANASRMPVTRLTVEASVVFFDPEGRWQTLQESLGLVVLPPTGDSPEQWRIEKLIRYHPDEDDLPDAWTPHLGHVKAVEFQDAQGRRWRRTLPDGDLTTV